MWTRKNRVKNGKMVNQWKWKRESHKLKRLKNQKNLGLKKANSCKYALSLSKEERKIGPRCHCKAG